MCHKPTPVVIVEAIVEVIAGVAHAIVLWKDDQHPLVVPNKRQG